MMVTVFVCKRQGETFPSHRSVWENWRKQLACVFDRVQVGKTRVEFEVEEEGVRNTEREARSVLESVRSEVRQKGVEQGREVEGQEEVCEEQVLEREEEKGWAKARTTKRRTKREKQRVALERERMPTKGLESV